MFWYRLTINTRDATLRNTIPPKNISFQNLGLTFEREKSISFLLVIIRVNWFHCHFQCRWNVRVVNGIFGRLFNRTCHWELFMQTESWNDALSENIREMSQRAREYVRRGVEISPRREKNSSQSPPVPLSLSTVTLFYRSKADESRQRDETKQNNRKKNSQKCVQTWRTALASSVFNPSTSIRLRTAATLLASLNSKSPACSFLISAAFVVA